jgi:hypothetical protein
MIIYSPSIVEWMRAIKPGHIISYRNKLETISSVREIIQLWMPDVIDKFLLNKKFPLRLSLYNYIFWCKVAKKLNLYQVSDIELKFENDDGCLCSMLENDI